jgi:serine/threonine-protein kinase PpkA
MRRTHLPWGRSARASRSAPAAITALICIALLLVMSTPAPAQSGQCTRPLLMQGKRTLFQRVLTRPGAVALEGPAGNRRQDLLAFSRLYVYERRPRNGREWLRLGTDERCRNIVGWVDVAQTVPWRQQLSLALTNPSGRGRLLFFRTLEDLMTVVDGADPAGSAQKLVEKLDAGLHVPEVAAVEPDTFVDLHKQFYLLPILDTKEFTTHSGRKVRALKVAAVTRASDRPLVRRPQPGPEPMKDFRMAVVFVIDTTISMKPYIEETREAIDHFYRRIEGAELLDKVAFGLVAFRSEARDKDKQDRLDYVARVFASPTEVNNGSAFMQRIKGLKPAPVTTDFFDEDAYAGIDAALRIPDWTDAFNARFLVLVTDAGALDGNPANRDPGARPGDPGRQSRTREDAATLQSRAASQGVAIAVMHLLTPQARDAGDIQRASQQYRELASNSDKAFNREAYFPIADGSVEAFRGAVDAFANALIDLMEQTKRGRVAAPGEAPIHRDTDNDGEYEAPPGDPGQTAALLGHAMLLVYLGERQQTTAPAEAFEAWITDTDLRDPGLRTAQPYVLMTRDQLSNLREIVLKVIDIAEPTLGQEGSTSSTKQFYERLASIAAWFERREDGGGSDAAKLSENDLLLEYLQDLPYRSEVLELKQDDWTRWSIDRQTQFIDRMRKKANLYRLYYGSLDCWVDIAQSNDAYGRQPVCPVPLRELP